MSAELLRRAAKELRDRASLATSSGEELRWTAVRRDESDRHLVRVVVNWYPTEDGMPDGYCVADMSMGAPADGWPLGQAIVDSEYIAMMHPPVALALADLLDVIGRFDEHPRAGTPTPDDPAYRLARAILRESS